MYIFFSLWKKIGPMDTLVALVPLILVCVVIYFVARSIMKRIRSR